MASGLFWFLIIFQCVGMLSTVYMIGKPRTPMTAGTAVISIVINLFIIGAVVIWGNA